MKQKHVRFATDLWTFNTEVLKWSSSRLDMAEKLSHVAAFIDWSEMAITKEDTLRHTLDCLYASPFVSQWEAEWDRSRRIPPYQGTAIQPIPERYTAQHNVGMGNMRVPRHPYHGPLTRKELDAYATRLIRFDMSGDQRRMQSVTSLYCPDRIEPLPKQGSWLALAHFSRTMGGNMYQKFDVSKPNVEFVAFAAGHCQTVVQMDWLAYSCRGGWEWFDSIL